ncbi:MAG: serine/threonine-protein kinase [Nannocystaceae bacterium]
MPRQPHRAALVDSRIGGGHTSAMEEQRRVGSYRLGRPLPTVTHHSRVVLANHEDDEEGVPPRFVAKITDVTGKGAKGRVARCEHEARLLRAFNHPGIPSGHADGVERGACYLIMDYVQGVDLATLLGHHTDEPRGLAREVAVYILAQLADALYYAHGAEVADDAGNAQSLDVLHRDICPANVLVSSEGDVLLGDFGSSISSWLQPQFAGKQAGHVAYMAPERVTGTGEVSQRSDLFSVAVILWEMLQGRRCFRAEDDLKTVDAISLFDISHASRRVTGLSPKLSEILRKNLDRDPSRRYTGAYQMLQRLAQAPEAGKAEQSRLALADMVQAATRTPPGATAGG